jgi:hypothetical protein
LTGAASSDIATPATTVLLKQYSQPAVFICDCPISYKSQVGLNFRYNVDQSKIKNYSKGVLPMLGSYREDCGNSQRPISAKFIIAFAGYSMDPG